MIDIDVFQTVTSVSFEVEPNTNVININKVTTSGYAGVPNLQEVTDEGASTTNGITINVGDGGGNGISSTSSQGYGVYGSSSESYGVYGTSPTAGVYGNSDNGYGVQGNSDNGIAVYGSSVSQIGVQGNSGDGTAINANSYSGTGLYSYSESGVGVSAYSNAIGLEVNGNGTIAIDVILGNSNKGLVINSGTSSTGNFIELAKNGVDKLVVNQQGELTATKLIKQGGTSAQFLMADGSVSTGGGGATNLSPSQTATNFTINSDTGTDATIPLGNGTLAGATLNDYTTAEKNKLAGIEAGANLGVPYTGATSDVNLGEFGVQLGNLEFDNTPTTIPTTQGSVYYNDTDGTLDLILKGGNVTLQLGQETVIRVVNKTATNISLLQGNYQAVRITGAQGQRPKVDLAQATNDVLSAETIGLVTETIANNQEGFIITSGLIRNINTTGSIQGETWLDGDILYLSPTVAGGITKVKPIAPNHLIIIGYVISAHVTQGTIFVKIDNGYELGELHDVKINGTTNNQVLAYTLATDIWENKTISTVLGYTPVESNTAITGATKTKITYDAKGLVTAGADATTADIADSTNKRYVTDANLTVIGNTSGTNTGDNATNTQYSGLAASKQDTLQSTVNIKSINGNSLLGSGNLTIGSASQSAFTILANNTNASAVATEQVYKDIAEQAYAGAIPIWAGTTAPTGTTNHSYQWSQIGKTVNLRVNLDYAIAGSGLTAVTFDFPSDCPSPKLPAGVSANGDVIAYGIGMLTSLRTSPATPTSVATVLRIKSSGTYEINILRVTASTHKYAYATIQYFAQ